MPDQRKSRGPHPTDHQLFGGDQEPLRRAVGDLSWLLTRGYPSKSALELVGNRHGLVARQRIAVARAACSDQARAGRLKKRCATHQLRGARVQVDGFNQLTTVEAALSGGYLLACRDGCLRDMASMHGSFRRVNQTQPALVLLGEVAAKLGIAHCHWLLDSPVSNSGRLAALIREVAAARGWSWTVALPLDPDRELAVARDVVVTADSGILDRCGAWFQLAAETVSRHLPESRILDLAAAAPTEPFPSPEPPDGMGPAT